MVGISEAAATATVLGTARKLLRELQQSSLAKKHQRTVNELLEIVADGQERLAELQAKVIDLQQANHDLRTQLDQVEDWQTRLSQYERFEAPAGAQVLHSLDGSHYACPRCAEADKQIHPLQGPGSKYSGLFTCPGCNKHYRINHAEKRPQVFTRRRI